MEALVLSCYTIFDLEVITIFNGFDFLTGNVHFIQDSVLDEDMLMVKYPNGHFLDIGWYGEESGFFIYLIKDQNWKVPLAKFLAKNEDELLALLPKAIEKIDMESKASKPYQGPLWKTDIHTA